MANGTDKWHKGSRFWMISMLVIVLSYSLVWATIFLAETQVAIALGSFGTLSLLVIGGGAAQNYKHGHDHGEP